LNPNQWDIPSKTVQGFLSKYSNRLVRTKNEACPKRYEHLTCYDDVISRTVSTVYDHTFLDSDINLQNRMAKTRYILYVPGIGKGGHVKKIK
jgi:hypothetical protein